MASSDNKMKRNKNKIDMNPFKTESLISKNDWSSTSLSDVSKFFKLTEDSGFTSNTKKYKIDSNNSNNSINDDNIDPFSNSNLENSSSIYPSTDISDSKSNNNEIKFSQIINEDIENLGRNDKNENKVKISQFIKSISELQWSKLIGIIFVLSGMIVAVLSGTIIAIQQESKSTYGKVNTSVFGKQYKKWINIRSKMVDTDTPNKFKSWNSSRNEEWPLVFSDEFNCEGRTFYPGDDQFWEAVDIHYAATNNMEWLDPSHVTTKEGTLRITMDERVSHGLNYTSGMLQSWNKLCFTQGYVETSIRMPGTKNAIGLWPAFWSLGNLARAGYMASTDGTWPYSYDTCDIGVTANQSSNDGLSFLPGQKLNSCICKGEDHPNPGTARAAPEIDIMEGLYDNFAQTLNVAPFDIWRYPDYDHVAIANLSTTAMNPFMGTPFQEAISAVVDSNENWYENGSFIKFGMEYRNDMKNNMENYINFYVNDQITFQITEGALHPDGNINWRTISKEPLSLIINLGLSKSWSKVDLSTIQFPVYMDVDYIRIYQPKDKISLTCDPKKYPTTDYIKNHMNAYKNANLTSWKMAGYEFPSYSLENKCPEK